MEPNCTMAVKTAPRLNLGIRRSETSQCLFLKISMVFLPFLQPAASVSLFCVSVGQFLLPECVLAWLLQHQFSMVLQVQNP